MLLRLARDSDRMPVFTTDTLGTWNLLGCRNHTSVLLIFQPAAVLCVSPGPNEQASVPREKWMCPLTPEEVHKVLCFFLRRRRGKIICLFLLRGVSNMPQSTRLLNNSPGVASSWIFVGFITHTLEQCVLLYSDLLAHQVLLR